MIKTVIPGLRSGTVRIPASKSDAQRAYLAAALAKGTSELSGFGNSQDEQAMRYAIQTLGAKVIVKDDRLIIKGISNFPETATINVGESGLGIRLLTSVCAAHTGTFTIEGQGSLTIRPMHFFEEVLPAFDVKCVTESGKLPIQVSGPMQGAEAKVDGSLSSQFVSGLLMALPLANGNSKLEVELLNSRPYVDMTLKTLTAFGIEIAENGNTFHIAGNQEYVPNHYAIEADWSSAGYWLVAGALGNRVTVQGLDLNSLQADKSLMNFLEMAGCFWKENESGISVDGTHKKPFVVDATDCPDLFPTLVVLAAMCKGTSIITGALRLEHKESHRGLTLQSEFAKLGIQIALNGDQMLVHGEGRIQGGNVTSHHDHRIAMALAIAATVAEGPVTISDAEAVAKSYTDFWNTLEAL